MGQSKQGCKEVHPRMLRLSKSKPPKVYCKPKLVPLAPSRTLQLITMDMAGREVAEKCLEYCLTFGIPESVLTDQDTNFTSQVIESLWERLDVHTLRTTSYHPQTDGITERFNRTIKTMLTEFVHEQKQDDWDQKLENSLSPAKLRSMQ